MKRFLRKLQQAINPADYAQQKKIRELEDKLAKIDKLMMAHIKEDKEMKRTHGIGMSGLWIVREVLSITRKPNAWMEAEGEELPDINYDEMQEKGSEADRY